MADQDPPPQQDEVAEEQTKSDAAAEPEEQKKAAAHADQVATQIFNRTKDPRNRDVLLEKLKFKEGDLTKRTYTFTCCFEDGFVGDSQYPKYEEYVREFTIIYINQEKQWKLEGQINTENDGTGSSVTQSNARW